MFACASISSLIDVLPPLLFLSCNESFNSFEVHCVCSPSPLFILCVCRLCLLNAFVMTSASARLHTPFSHFSRRTTLRSPRPSLMNPERLLGSLSKTKADQRPRSCA